MQQALLAFLRSAPALEVLPQVEGELADCLGDALPELLILDAKYLSEQGWRLLGRLRALAPGMRCLVIAHTQEHMQAARHAGVDRTLLAGFSAAEFFQTLNDLSPLESSHET